MHRGICATRTLTNDPGQGQRDSQYMGQTRTQGGDRCGGCWGCHARSLNTYPRVYGTCKNGGKRTGVRNYPKASPGCASSVRVLSVCNAACDVWSLIDDCVPCVVPGHDQFCHCVEKGVLARGASWCRPSPPHGDRQGSRCWLTIIELSVSQHS